MREIYYLDSIKETISQLMRKDPRVFMIGEDIGVYGGGFGLSVGLLEEFGPERIIDTPISEQAIVGMGIGSALMGRRPIVEIMFSDFMLLAMEQIVNQAAKIHYMFGGKASVPLVIRTPGGGGTGAAAQHSQSLEALLLHIPGIKIVMPSSPYDAKGLLVSAIEDPNPVIYLEHKLLYKKVKGEVPEEEYEIPLGKADIKRSGKDITVVATSFMVQEVLSISEDLYREGIDIEIIDPMTIKPLDMNTILESIKRTGRAVLVEEACYTGGFTAFLASEIQLKAFDWLDCPIERITGLDSPIPYSKVLEDEVIPSENRIKEGIRKIFTGD
jgi:acetoin:2,6-dichlorophenolindophenol oxidoreductase subunit beta